MEAQQMAESLLKDVDCEWVAEDVEDAVRDVGMDELGSRAGSQSWGYVEPGEAAWEILQERISPFIEDMKRQLDLGLDAEALEMCKGIVLGLYRVRNAQDDHVLQWAPEFPAETAGEAVAAWRGDGGKKKAARARRTRLAFPSDFAKESVPEWEDLIARW